MNLRVSLGFALVLAACSSPDAGTGSDGGTGIPGLTSIDVSPASSSLVVQNGVAATQQFSALGHFADGHTEDVTAKVSWTLSDVGIGLVDDAGAFTSSINRGGKSQVSAAAGSATGQADLTVKLVTSKTSTSDGSTAPADASTHFTGATDDPTLAPTLAYPLDGALVPHNLGLLEVQWQKPAAADLFEVSFQSDTLDLKIYSNAVKPGGGLCSLTPSDWYTVADSVNGSTVKITVRAAQTSVPGKAGTSASATLTVGRGDVQGGIYYWTTTNDQGTDQGLIVRHAFGDTTAMPQQFYAPNNGARCAGCHALTRDGTRFAITYDGGNNNSAELTVAMQMVLVPENANLKWNFAAFAPDGNRMVAGGQGLLRIIDSSGGAANGTVLQTLENGAGASYGTHPDWSPDGNAIVYTRVGQPSADQDWHFGQGSIWITRADTMGVFGAMAQPLVPSQGGQNNYYPSFSADGKWVIFNRSMQDAYDDPDAELWVVSTDGLVGPVRLGKANGAVPNVTNSWPRWSPFAVPGGGGSGELLYFTFSSKRAYGIEVTGAPQIWMGAFDPKAAAAGDPSFVPFWVPYQDVKTHNHIAQWTTQIVGIN